MTVESIADEIRLTIERGSEPIAGQVDFPDGRALRFEGYMQLVGFLEEAREPRDSSQPDGEPKERR